MKTGLLWYDGDNQRLLHEKIRQAAQRYRQKYGRMPTICYVHPSALAGQAAPEPGLDCRWEDCSTTIWVIAAPNILPHHFWLGEGDPSSVRVVAQSGDRPRQERERPLQKANGARKEADRLMQEAVMARAGVRLRRGAKKAQV